MRRNHGFTLIELLIVVAVLAILAAIALQGVASCGIRGSAEFAEQEARSHAQKLGWKVQGVACTAVDTDGDGYISCSLALQDGTERALECASGGLGSVNGCKTAPLIKTSTPTYDGRFEE